MMRFLMLLFFLACYLPAVAQIQIVAAENMYGDIAKTLGGKEVQVTSILNNPNQDPHLFSADPKTVKLLSKADLVILNGADYDPWAESLLKNTPAQVINVASINQVPKGSNPHLWYNLTYVAQFAKTLTNTLSALQPSNAAIFQQNLKQFLTGIEKINQQIKQQQTQYQNIPVTATEPIAGYLAEALGLSMRNTHFQLSVMNDTEPSAKDRAAMLNDLIHQQVNLLIYNQQVTDPTTRTIKQAAQAAGIPIVGVTELLPLTLDNNEKTKQAPTYLVWYQNTLDHIIKAMKK